MTGALVAIAVAAVATVFGLLRRRREGVLRPAGESYRRRHERIAPADLVAELSDELGAGLGARATFVQFSSAFCAPCRATRAVLTEVTEMVDGVVHVEIDAESRLDLVRRLGVVRTPTVFVLDHSGQIMARGVGRPRKADMIAALDGTIPVR